MAAAGREDESEKSDQEEQVPSDEEKDQQQELKWKDPTECKAAIESNTLNEPD